MSSSSYNRKIKLEHFQNLVAVAFADGFLDEAEKEFLMEKAEEFGIPSNEALSIVQNAKNLQFMVPLNNHDREEQLSDVVFIAMVDGEVHEKEYNLCVTIAQKLDLTRQDVDQVIKLTQRLWKSSG